MSETKRGNNIKLAWAKKTKLGYWSEDIGPAQFEALQQVAIGGRLSLKSVMCKNKEGKEFEAFVFEFLTPDTVTRLKQQSPHKPVQREEDDL